MVRKEDRRGLIPLWLMVSFIGLGGCSANSAESSFMRTPSMLAPQSPVAAQIANLGWFMIILGSLIYIGVMLYLAHAIWRNRGYDLEEELKRPNEGNSIVLTWGVGFTGIVLVILFSLNISTMRAHDQMFHGEQEIVIDVIGRQWWWEIQYTEQDFETANEIHIPVGKPVILRLLAKDVIHSLWIPELSGKLDLLPNQVNELILIADKTGEFWGECAEYCGTQHANMRLIVIVQTEQEFAAWLEHQQTLPPPLPEDELAAEGQQIFSQYACVKCHTIEGTNASGDLGPDLTHLGSRRTIGAGSIDYSLGNEALWIINSHTIKPGNLMPPTNLSEEDLAALLAYLETLK